MRKIDAVLLSALILYDYSAQSLVDSDIINLGNSLIAEHNSFREDKPVDPSFLTDRYSNTLPENNTEPLNLYGLDATPAKNISYHDLAKINPATAITATQPEDNSNMLIHISMPNAFMEEAAMLPESLEQAAEESTLTLSVATVTASFASLSDAGNIEVKDEFDADNMQFADTDADGMFNFEDKCPAIAGVARFEGCPVPDSDADGINDEEDYCPFEAGTIAGSGCPLENDINTTNNTSALNNDQADAVDFSTVVKFEENNDVLSNSDFNMVLQLADKLLNNAGAKIDIYKSADINAAAQTNTIMRYLKDLGVNDSQINLSLKDTGSNAVVRGVAVQIRY
ncbi:hypothetical protein [Agriterribacter sp.]|uniref:hypothetical protein n=1 Tax=Agriterribacter sp. TaxID=2821509 RepID=UPI002C9B2F9A|nr:hypothetical protein [Agriterribacter sp.]HRO45513.1 hypothetical protein [Agriterribacter sp.]HRQ19459.1 hypothetical protein [Agriterribacter sp.]